MSNIHPALADWYRAAGIEPTNEALPKRWQGLEAFQADKKAVVELTRWFFKLGNFSETPLVEFQQALKDADTLYPMRNNDQELRVLAGAKLASIIAGKVSDISIGASLAVVCATVQNLRGAPCIADIPEIAARKLRAMTIDRFRGIGIPSGASAALPDGLLEEFAKGNEPNAKLGQGLKRLQVQVEVLSEESNMLWWLFSEHSRDMATRWAEIGLQTTTIIAGKELADLTWILPGPAAATAFLDRVIRLAKTKVPSSVEIAETVNALSADWRLKFVGVGWQPDLDALMPISTAVKSAVTSPNNNQWAPAFRSITQLTSDAKIGPASLSYQLYLECLLRRAFAGIA